MLEMDTSLLTSYIPSSITAARVESAIDKVGSCKAGIVDDTARVYSLLAATIKSGATFILERDASPRAATADCTAELFPTAQIVFK
jgi:hypothetical protein